MTPRQRTMLIAVGQKPGHRGFRGPEKLVWASLIKKGWVERNPNGFGWSVTKDGWAALGVAMIGKTRQVQL